MDMKNLNDDMLEVELSAINLSKIDNDKPDQDSYVALSWCWRAYGGEGDEEQQLQHIKVLQDNKHYSFEVSHNLHAALKALYRCGVFRIWVDWICIDQHSVVERSD